MEIGGHCFLGSAKIAVYLWKFKDRMRWKENYGIVLISRTENIYYLFPSLSFSRGGSRREERKEEEKLHEGSLPFPFTTELAPSQ